MTKPSKSARKCPRCGEDVPRIAGLFRCAKCGHTQQGDLDEYVKRRRSFYDPAPRAHKFDGSRKLPTVDED